MCHGSLPSRPITPFLARATAEGDVRPVHDGPLTRAPARAKRRDMTEGQARLIAEATRRLGPKGVVTDPRRYRSVADRLARPRPRRSAGHDRAGFDRRGRRDRHASPPSIAWRWCRRAAIPACRGRHAANRRVRAAPVDAPDEPHPLGQRRKPACGRRSGRDPRQPARCRARSRHALSADARRARKLYRRRTDFDERRRHPGAEVRDHAHARRRARSRASRRIDPQRPVRSQEGQSRLQPRPAADRRGRHARGDHCGGAPARARAGGSRGRLGRGGEPAARARSASLPRNAHQQHRRVRAGAARIAFSSC